jgi:hypothetical protein
MKYLLFLLLLPITASCQMSSSASYRIITDSTMLKSEVYKPKYDTVRASLLLTRKKMTIAHNYEGYAVLYDGHPLFFLDDRKRRFRMEATVWQYKIIKH